MDLLPEIKNNIFLILLRLIIDDIEDDPFRLVESTKPSAVSSFFGVVRKYNSVNNIDYYIKLLRIKPITVNPNILSYKGNTIFHLLVEVMMKTVYLGKEDTEFLHLQNKIILLCKYGIDINRKDCNGNTIAHRSFMMVFNGFFNINNRVNIIEFLLKLEMDIRLIKNNHGYTAYQIAEIIIKHEHSNNASSAAAMKLLLNDFILHDSRLRNVKNTLNDFKRESERYQKCIKVNNSK
jgi:hypothetical protein